MAADIENGGGVNVQIGADTSAFTRSTDEAVSHLSRRLEDVSKQTSANMGSVGNRFSDVADHTREFIAQAKANLKECREDIETLRDMLAGLKIPSNFKTIEGASSAMADYREVKEAAANMRYNMSDFRSEIERGAKAYLDKEYTKELETLGKQYDTVAAQARKLGHEATAGLSKASEVTQKLTAETQKLATESAAVEGFIKKTSQAISENAAHLEEYMNPSNFKTMESASVSVEGVSGVSENLKTLSAGIKEARGEISKLQKKGSSPELDKMDKQLVELGNAASELGRKAQQGLGEAREATRALAVHGGTLDGITSRVKGLVAAYLSFRGVRSLISGIMSATISQSGAERILAGRVSATGGTVGFSADELKQQAKALQDVTTYSDQAVMGMQSMLLIFKSVRGDNFVRATQAAMDLSTALGGDLRTNAMRLGRALEDPARGMNQLRRAGVVLSASQQQLIKDFMKVGDIASAQDVILKQVESTIGGAAKSYRNTLGGAFEALRVKWNSLKEMNDRNAFGGLTESVNELIDALSSDEVDSFRKSIGDLAGSAIKGLISTMKFLADNVTGVRSAFTALVAVKVTEWALGMLTSIGQVVKMLHELDFAATAAKMGTMGWIGVAAGATGGLLAYAKSKEDARTAQIERDAAEQYKKYPEFIGPSGYAQIQDRDELTDRLESFTKEKELLEGRLKKLQDLQKEASNISVSDLSLSATSITGSTEQWEKFQEGSGASTSIAQLKGQLRTVNEEISAAQSRLDELNRLATGAGALNPEDYMTPERQHGWERSEVEQKMDKYRKLRYLDTQKAAETASADLPDLEKMRDGLKPMSDDWIEVSGAIETCLGLIRRAKEEMLANAGWDNRNGFLGDLEYYEMLREELGKTAKETDEWKSIFSQLSSAADNLINKDFETVTDDFEDGKMTLEEYAQKLREIVELYGEDLPEVKRKGLETVDDIVEREKGSIYNIKDFTDEWLTDLQQGITDALFDFDTFGDALSNLGERLEKMAVQLALFGQDGRSGILGSLFGGGGLGGLLLGGFGGGLFSAKGNVFDRQGLIPFARGGVVDKPTVFQFAKGTGLMGEAGPEAIMPLHRDSQGRLGVAVAASSSQSGGGTPSFAPVINVNVENNGSGEMSEEQANAMSGQITAVVDARIADQLCEYKRRGFFRANGAYA